MKYFDKYVILLSDTVTSKVLLVSAEPIKPKNMNSSQKKLYIVNGCSGALGNIILSLLARNPENIVYGLSRKAIYFHRFGSKLPVKTLVTSIGDTISDKEALKSFAKSIPSQEFSSINYIHAVGLYPFEVNKHGVVEVENDLDGDGINDECLTLTFHAFTRMCEVLTSHDLPFTGTIFGGLADKFKPAVHQSWWKTMNKVKDYMRDTVSDTVAMNVLNISSVICFHELLTRPFVFSNTNATPEFWLTPDEVAREVIDMIDHSRLLTERDLFHKSTYYHANYFHDEEFTERKIKELGIK